MRNSMSGVMKLPLPATLCIAMYCGAACVATSQQQTTDFLQFPARDVADLGPIDRLVVTVNCSWISDLREVPELYNIEMGYDTPTVNVLSARPRLGAAAVDLSKWSGVVGVHVPADADRKPCFGVTVMAQGRSGTTRQWTDGQLGLKK